MTPALQAVVAAMIAELQAQAASSGQFADNDMEHPIARAVRLDGTFDLEKVARAGLAAIKGVQPPDLKAVYQAADDHSCFVSAEALAAMIDAILKP